jgi:cyanophycinase
MGGPGWERHLSEYVEPWRRCGAREHFTIVPGESGALDVAAASKTLLQATGIFIGGGHSPTYHRLYATEPMRAVIQERFNERVPVAGLSAGALIAPEVCALYPKRGDATPLRIERGLGLLEGQLLAVHFAEREALPQLIEAMARTRTGVGLGIDEGACAVLENGRLARVIGRSVHEIVMTDFEAMTYRVTEVT